MKNEEKIDMQIEDNSFAKRIKMLRTEQRLQQQELAAIFDLSRSTVCDYEHGRVTPDTGTLIRIAKYFDVTIDYLLGLTNERKQVIVINEDKTFKFALYDEVKDMSKEQQTAILELVKLFKIGANK